MYEELEICENISAMIEKMLYYKPKGGRGNEFCVYFAWFSKNILSFL